MRGIQHTRADSGLALAMLKYYRPDKLGDRSMKLTGAARPHRAWLLIGYDGLSWVAGLTSMAIAAASAGIGVEGGVAHALWLGVVAASLHAVGGALFKVHRGRAALASFEDVVLVANLVAIVSIVMVMLNFSGRILIGQHFVRTLSVGAGCVLALVLMLWGRVVYRIYRDRSLAAAGLSGPRTPTVVIGAGEAAHQLLGSMMRDATGTWEPVALLDDDPLKRHRRIRGVQVRGRLQDLPAVADQVGAVSAILAIPSASAELVRSMQSMAKEEGIDLKVLPGTNELYGTGHVSIRDVRDIDITDILGRHQIDTDLKGIAGYLTGKRVLVTGAGGSIGSELCRQIAAFDPAQLMMLDRDESALHAVELSIHGKAMLDTDETVLCDIRDTDFVNSLFERRRPEVVFHAAALKHLPLLEKAPGEAVKTNVWGTLNVLEAAKSHGVERFVNVSTDKAANPCSVLGYSKRLAEGLTAHVAAQADGAFLSVRFGNVLGSRGSVLTAFASQIAAGGPVTVTDPSVTRYFMTIQEAVQLVIQAGAIGTDGEVLVLDMGEPISIDGVARRLIDQADRPIDIVYTGLRPGEKMHEELFGANEVDIRPRHPLISHTRVPEYEASEARELDARAETAGVTFAMERACAQMLDALPTNFAKRR